MRGTAHQVAMQTNTRRLKSSKSEAVPSRKQKPALNHPHHFHVARDLADALDHRPRLPGVLHFESIKR